MSGWWTCRICGGTGDLPKLQRKCPLCAGNGTVGTLMAATQECVGRELLKFRTGWPVVVALTVGFWLLAACFGVIGYAHSETRRQQRLLREANEAAATLVQELNRAKK